MSLSQGEIDHVTELFSGLGDLTVRKMFGGVGLYHQGTIFAVLMSDGTLRIKGAGAFQDVLEAEGCTRWTYTREGSDTIRSMPYWTMPDGAQDDPDLACDWARRALEHL
ncbi:TfoX/Sxy family protein [Gymnodinialimonas sp. 2305UL16-5]|uniref:TfoX/Sxy family protein n=1 Tax=Gymnodinialimonas mytili TaxID=3126503 RepID=UPI0030B0E6B0